MVILFTAIIFATLLPRIVTQWQCTFCYNPFNLQLYPYCYTDLFHPSVTIRTRRPSQPFIGPCVNGQCPIGYGCYQSQCVAISNYYGQCINNQCQVGFCYNGQCVG